VELRGWRLLGGEELANPSTVRPKMERLRALVAGLESGNIRFIEKGMLIGGNE
jgi:hypothetical protein